MAGKEPDPDGAGQPSRKRTGESPAGSSGRGTAAGRSAGRSSARGGAAGGSSAGGSWGRGGSAGGASGGDSAPGGVAAVTSAVTSTISSGVSGSATMARLRHPSRRLTTRAAILAAVICALVLSLAYPLKQYLAQRGSISQLRQEIATREAALAQLKERKRELSDPTYIKSRARQRLQYVMPGDTQFVVVHQGEHPGAAGQPRSTRSGATSPWYSQLWDSVQKADRSP